MTPFATVSGKRCASVRVVVANVGPWFAEVDLEDDSALEGRVELVLGALTLSGTVAPAQSGTFGLQRKVRIVAGAGAWGAEIPAKHYHNDARVKARNVAEDAARECGESIGSFVPTAERVGIDYVRAVGQASRALELAAGGAPWWVDFAGQTHVGPRAEAAAASDAYEVLAYDPREHVATLAVDDLTTVGIGSVISDRLDGPQTIREYEIRCTPDELRVVAWTGGVEGGSGRLAGLFRSIVERAGSAELSNLYRYRVVRMAGDRVELQAVSRAVGLPDVLPVSMWPGVAGVHAELTPGAGVLVAFVDGDPTAPVVTHFAGKDGDGFAPVILTIGGDGAAFAARLGDTVEVLLPPAVFTGVVGGVPASGALTFPLGKTLGTITGSSGRVKIA